MGKWKTGASASRAGYMAAYRAGVNKGNRKTAGGPAPDLGAVTKAVSPDKTDFAGKTQASPGVGSSREYGKHPGRQTAQNKDGTAPESNATAMPEIRAEAPAEPTAKGAIPTPFPGLTQRGRGI